MCEIKRRRLAFLNIYESDALDFARRDPRSVLHHVGWLQEQIERRARTTTCLEVARAMRLMLLLRAVLAEIAAEEGVVL